mgnify:CR=1 FL=1
MAQVLGEPLHTLHARLVEGASEVRVVKALRAARTTLGDAAEVPDVEAIRNGGGPIFVGCHSNGGLIATAADQLTDLSDDQAIPLVDWAGEDEAEDDPEDETLGHQVALVLMGLTDGKPVGAMIGAFNLRNVLDDDVYGDAIAALIEAYPALEDVAVANDLL